MLLFMDVQAIIIPQLNVIPKNSWGQYVILFMKGYENANSIDPKPNTIVKKLNWIKIIKAKAHKNIT